MISLTEIRESIASTKIELAIAQLEAYLSEQNIREKYINVVTSIKYRLTSITESIHKGVTFSEEERVTKARIVSDLLELITNLETTVKLSKSQRPIFLKENILYTCNRQEQVKAFEVSISRRIQSKIDAFLIHGNEDESPVGLYKRLCENEIKYYVQEIEYLSNPLPMSPQDDLEYFQITFLRSLFQALRLDNRHINILGDVSALYNSPLFMEKECVVLGIKLYSYEWKNSVMEMIEWFLNDYCQVEIEEHKPKIIFFFQFNYSEPEKKKSWFSSLFTKDKTLEIQHQLESIDYISQLPKLGSVALSDINSWLDIITHNAEEKKKYLMDFFDHRASFSMGFVEGQLKKIIKQYNKSNPQF